MFRNILLSIFIFLPYMATICVILVFLAESDSEMDNERASDIGHCLTYQQIDGLSSNGQLVINAHACIRYQTASLPTPVNWLL